MLIKMGAGWLETGQSRLSPPHQSNNADDHPDKAGSH